MVLKIKNGEGEFIYIGGEIIIVKTREVNGETVRVARNASSRRRKSWCDFTTEAWLMENGKTIEHFPQLGGGK